MMYTPQESFPINGTNSMEEFPAMISNATSSSPPSASDENLSPPTTVSFAQMLKQQAPPPPPVLKATTMNRPISATSSAIEISTKNKKNKKNKSHNDNDDDLLNEDEEYYASVPNFHSSFSLEEVFDRLKLGLHFVGFFLYKRKILFSFYVVNGEEHPVTSIGEATGNVTTKKKNKKNKQILFATGLGGQAKL